MRTNRFIAIYVRVSTVRQDHRSQLADLERWAEAQDAEVRWYRDKASGPTMDRPGWNRLEKDMEAGQVAKVACWRLDRLGRTAAGLTALFERLRDRDVGLVSVKDAVDLDTPAGRLMSHVLASVAAYETEVRNERVRAGIAAARANGKTWGGSKKGRRLAVTPEQAAAIVAMKAKGRPVAAIARATGLSRPTVYRVLDQQS